jgi:hypothetical protein
MDEYEAQFVVTSRNTLAYSIVTVTLLVLTVCLHTHTEMKIWKDKFGG